MDGILSDLWDWGRGLLTQGVQYGEDWVIAQYQNPQDAFNAMNRELAQLAGSPMSDDDIATAIDRITTITSGYSSQSPQAEMVWSRGDQITASLGAELRGQLARGTTVRLYLPGGAAGGVSNTTLAIGAVAAAWWFLKRRKTK